MATLTVMTGSARGRSMACDRELVIGREQGDLVIDDPELSGRHAAVRPGGDGVEVEDLGSAKGTFVDGQKVSGVVRVTSSCRLRVGTTEIGIDLAADGVKPAPASAGDEDRNVTAVRTAPPPTGPPRTHPSSAPDAPRSEPPHLPPPVRLLMKTPLGRRLLPLMIRLPERTRRRVVLLISLTIVVLILAIVVLLVLLIL